MALNERTVLEDGSEQVVLADASARHNFWLVHMAAEYPHMAEAAGRLLSAHVTSATGHSLRVQDISFMPANSSLGKKGADEEVMLSIADLEEGEEEEGETMDE
eukprot:1146302-Pelagomonas_calceolata.AAC.2